MIWKESDYYVLDVFIKVHILDTHTPPHTHTLSIHLDTGFWEVPGIRQGHENGATMMVFVTIKRGRETWASTFALIMR